MTGSSDILSTAQALHAGGKSGEALQILDDARKASTAPAPILFLMGNILQDLGQHEGAVQLYRAASRLLPDDPGVRNNLANSLHELGRSKEAAAEIDAALKMSPAIPDLWLTHGAIALGDGQWDVARTAFEKCLTLSPENPKALANLAELDSCVGDYAAAIEKQKKAIAAGADTPQFYFNLGCNELAIGRFAEGWAHYEARLGWNGQKGNVVPRPFTFPRWDGSYLNGKALLVAGEQGLGEEILYASMFREAEVLAGHLIVECAPRLCPLFTRSFPSITFLDAANPVDLKGQGSRIGAFLHAGSLGGFLRSGWDSFPKQQGLLTADPGTRDMFRRDYMALANGRKIVGISWRSKPLKYGDPKSSAIADWGALLTHPDFFCIDLQYGDTTADRAFVSDKGWHLYHDDRVDSMKDLDLFASQIAALDQVVSISNTTVHVSGGLGVPTLVLLPDGNGSPWHWFADRTDSPFHPSLTLMRKKRAESWGMKVQQAVAHLVG
jgi:Flp pilus assembly protein TadD